jgi:tetratricopeptide (TPR) repeat protein
MNRYATVTVAALLLASCGGSDNRDNPSEWRRVLHWKKAAAAPTATVQQKQVYADSVAAFVEAHPTHSRARQVYETIQLDFARELASLGRYQDAIRFYRAVLTHDPQNEKALKGIAEAADHLAVTRQKLLALEKGMSQHDVAKLLGKPIPGWTARIRRHDSVIESWYYRKSDDTIAGVYFRDGELFAAEESSQARLAPLTRSTAQ